MNYTSLFYWLTVADNAKTMFVIFFILFGVIAAIATIAYLGSASKEDEQDEKDQAMSRKWMWWSYPFFILFMSLYVFTPSKRDALLIVAGGTTLNFLTTDSASRQIPKELSNFVVSELKNMASSAKVELSIKDQKQKMLEEVKDLTTEELLKKMKTDTLLKKALLND